MRFGWGLRAALTCAVALPGGEAQAARLIDVSPVDEQIVMIQLKDGDVVFQDDGAGPSGLTGHDFAPGDDARLLYGEPLDTDISADGGPW